MKLYKLIVVIMVLGVPLIANAQMATDDDDEILVLQNVLINDIDGEVYNLEIRNGMLNVITDDPIPKEHVDLIFDAQQALLIGQIEVGSIASFIVLDPAVDPVEALLDTRQYASFVIVKGDVVKNTLAVSEKETELDREIAAQGWLAYTPPPRIRQTSDANRNNWNRFSSRYIDGILAGAVVLDRQRWLDQDEDSESQVGDLDAYSGGEIRALRVGAVGTVNFAKPWVWTLFGATHAFDKGFDQTKSDDLSLFDARLDIPLYDKVTFSVGMQKEPISMERTMSMVDMPQQERAAVSDALLPARNTGVVMAGNLLNDRVSIAGGVFNNFLEKGQPSSISDNGTQYVGRATWLPYTSKDESTLLHVGVGLRYSNLKEGSATGTEPEFNNSPDFLVVDSFMAEKSETIQLEASFRTGPFWLHSEYIATDIKSPLLGNPRVDGYHATLSWIASGEMRPYNKSNGTFRGIPISRNVNQNGWGAWEFSTRYSHTDLTDGLFNGGEMDIWSAGVNWWLTSVMNFNLNYRFITLDKNAEKGNSQGFNARIVLILE